jgi:hypothetical protein
VTRSLIADRDLFMQVCAMLTSKAPSTNICDIVGMLTGKAFSAQQLANFRRKHLGGGPAFDSLRFLLSRFASFDGSTCLILDDDDGRVCGIMLQSAAQRAVFDRWGENLILDWTHNTNNVGYYLGE